MSRTSRFFLWNLAASAAAVALGAQTLPPPAGPGQFDLDVTHSGETWQAQYDYNPPSLSAQYPIKAEKIGVARSPQTITTKTVTDTPAITAEAGETTVTFNFDPGYAANHPEIIKPIFGDSGPGWTAVAHYSQVTLKTTWDAQGLPTFILDGTEANTGRHHTISGRGPGRLFRSGAPSSSPVVFHAGDLTQTSSGIGWFRWYPPNVDYRYLPGTAYYFTQEQPDGTTAVFHPSYYNQVGELREYYPIGELTLAGTPGHGATPASQTISYLSHTEEFDQANAYSQLKAESNALAFSDDKFELTTEATAHYALSAEGASASKLRYKLGIQPGLARTITWAETFTPDGATEPADYAFLSETVTAGAIETQPHIIDPFAAGRFGAQPGIYQILTFEGALSVDTNHDGAIMSAVSPITPPRIANADQGALGADLQFRPNQNDDVDAAAPEETGGGPDHLNSRVDGVDDLQDFIPVYLDIGQFLTLLSPTNGFTYKLKQADEALNFVYTNLTQATAFSYRGNPEAGFGPDFTHAASTAPTVPITAAGTDMFEGDTGSAAFRDYALTINGAVILIEARRASDQPLVLEISRGSMIVASIQLPLLVFNPQLAVDTNRDGAVKLASEDASDATSVGNPFRFWLNDDDDRNKVYTYSDQLPGFMQAPASLIPGALAVQEEEQDDLAVSSASDQNWNNSVIDCERDLEDFARLLIYTSGLNDSLKNGQLSLGLKWTDVSSGNPAIRLFKHAEADGGTKYLTDPATAHQQIDQTGAAYGLALGTGLVEGSTPFVLPQSVFANLSDSAPTTYLLFEGCKAGKGQLKLVILKPKGDGTYDIIGEGPGIWMELKEPHEFVERWSCGDGDRSDVQPVVRENANSASPAWGNPTTDDEKDYILYVHGYNMKEFEKQRWLETTFKRVYWLGYKGRVGGFTWPCSQSAPPFDESEEKAWQSAGQLMNLLASLKTAGYRVHVMAHSQGNVVVGEALRQWKTAGNTTPLVSTYIASQAAIAAHCYASNVLLIPDFEDSASDDHTPNVYLNYPPTGAPYMEATAMQGAASRYANFYNISDYALTGNSAVHPGWEVDQRWKPNIGYGYTPYDESSSGFYKTNSAAYRFPDDRFKIFAYCAEARSKALGTMPTGGVFTSFTNLQSSLSYGSEHIYHSGQFRSYYAARYQYWATLLTNLGLQPFLP